MASIITSDITLDHLTQLTDLARLVVDPKKTEAYYRWKYFDNLDKQSLGRCALENQRVIGNHGSVPVQLQLGASVCSGAQLVDAMVSPEFRRLGIFTTLSQETDGKMARAGVQVAFVFPAPVTLKALTHKLGDWGWVHVANVPRLVCIVDALRAAKSVTAPAARLPYALWLHGISSVMGSTSVGRGTSPITLEEVTAFDERFDKLWLRASPGLGFSVSRTASYLQWRYHRHPEKEYRCLAVSSTNTLNAYIVLCELELQRVPTWELVEFIVDQDHIDAGLALLHEVRRQAREAKIAQLTTWMLPHHRAYGWMLRRAGFVHSTSRLAPGRFGYTVPLVVQARDKNRLSSSPLIAENWYVAMGDSDLH